MHEVLAVFSISPKFLIAAHPNNQPKSRLVRLSKRPIWSTSFQPMEAYRDNLAS